jgi:hypothetical protein
VRCSHPRSAERYQRIATGYGITRSHLRELAIYADDDPRIAAYRPAALAIERDDEKKRWVLALEAIDDAVLYERTVAGGVD